MSGLAKRLRFHARAAAALALCACLPLAAQAESCYDGLEYAGEVATAPKRALYVLVDQTMMLDSASQARVRDLLASWGRPGDLIKVASFSANMPGRYPQVAFSARIEEKADERFLYNLRYAHKQALKECLKNNEKQGVEGFQQSLAKLLKEGDNKIPKTELFFSLRELSRQLIRPHEAPEQTVFLITDGMENSRITSFYHKGKMRTLKPRKELSKLRRAGLIPTLHGARVYVYGLGMSSAKNAYGDPRKLEQLRRFWERYLVEGRGKIAAIGLPELFLSTIE